MSRRGVVPGASAGANAVGILRGGVGDANIVPGALSTGKTESGQAVGRTDAVTVEMALSGSKTTYEVQHRLGRVPGFVKLVGVRNGVVTNTTVAIAWVDRDRWTETTARIYVNLLSGSLDNATLTVEVGGGR